MKTLKLTLKNIWFDMIASGEKTEEYREIKAHWYPRFTKEIEFTTESNPDPDIRYEMREYDQVEFTNGYGKHRPRITLECKGIHIDTGWVEWGAEEGEKYFVIKLGNVLDFANMPGYNMPPISASDAFWTQQIE